MRTLPKTACVATAAATVLLAAPAAYADAPGDNGTVKVHKLNTSVDDMRNQPHVCGFYLDAFQFDGRQDVSWKIVGKPPTDKKGTVAEHGTITLGDDGHGFTAALALPDGHYKLIWNFDGEHGKAKHKTFWVDCAGLPGEDNGGNPGPTPSEGASTTPADDASQPASPAPSAPAAEESSAAAAASAAPSPNGGSEDLAETGSSAPVGAIAGAAALLLGAGAYLTLRRRNSRASRQH